MGSKKEVDDNYKLVKKDNNGVIYSFYWWVGYKFAYFFKWLSLTPNNVSWFSFLFYCGSAVTFVSNNYYLNILGGILFYLGVQMDATDGKLARITNNTSKYGIWLDYNFDYIRPLFIYPTIALNIYSSDGNILWFGIAFIALCTLYLFTIISMRWDMFDFAEELKEDYIGESKYHKYLKQFYFYEGIEPLVVIIAFSIGWQELYLIGWTLCLIAIYLGSTLIWGKEIRKRDKLNDE